MLEIPDWLLKKLKSKRVDVVEFRASVLELEGLGLGELEAMREACRERGIDGSGIEGTGGGLDVGDGGRKTGGASSRRVKVAGAVAKEAAGTDGAVGASSGGGGGLSGSLAAVSWVADNLGNAGVKVEDAPSGVAWNLLKWVRGSAANEQDFWRQIWPKVLPTRQQVQADIDRGEDRKSLNATVEFLDSLSEEIKSGE